MYKETIKKLYIKQIKSNNTHTHTHKQLRSFKKFED